MDKQACYEALEQFIDESSSNLSDKILKLISIKPLNK